MHTELHYLPLLVQHVGDDLEHAEAARDGTGKEALEAADLSSEGPKLEDLDEASKIVFNRFSQGKK